MNWTTMTSGQCKHGLGPFVLPDTCPHCHIESLLLVLKRIEDRSHTMSDTDDEQALFDIGEMANKARAGDPLAQEGFKPSDPQAYIERAAFLERAMRRALLEVSGDITWREILSAAVNSSPMVGAPCYQDRVSKWAVDCFGLRDAMDPVMRPHRFLEEALELGQACGCSKREVLRILEYVYGRPVGEIEQEVGGVQVSLGVLCTAFNVNLEYCGEREFLRIVQDIEKIRERHRAKPNFRSPRSDPSALPNDAVRWVCPKCTTANAIDQATCTGCNAAKPATST